MRTKTSTTLLPKALRETLGIEDGGPNSKKKFKKKPLDRKARRKLDRQNSRPPTQKRKFTSVDDDESQSDTNPNTKRVSNEAAAPRHNEAATQIQLTPASRAPVKSILKKTSKSTRQPGRSPSPPPVIRKAVLDKLTEDDAEIARLEKKLKIKGKKLPKSFEEDGLDFLLEGLDDGGSSGGVDEDRQYLVEKRGRKRKRDEVLQMAKVQLSEPKTEKDSEVSDPDDDSEGLSEGDVDDTLDEGSSDGDDDGMLNDDDDFDGFDSDMDIDDEEESETPHPTPNDTKDAPFTPSVKKYIPPSLRKVSPSETESLSILRRKLQGHLNRLSESNLLQIMSAIEEIYCDNPRQNVTSVLTELILTSTTSKATLQDTFMILHGGFIAALYRVIGVDFGAHVVQTTVEDFEKYYSQSVKNATSSEGSNGTGKKANNLLVLLLELYNFGVIGSVLIFDFIRIIVKDMNELNTELLLKITRNSGPQLRQDDPSALKDIVTMMQPAITKVGLANLSTRTRFMIESLTNLKNNKGQKSANGSSVLTSETTVRMKRTLGTLNSRQLRASEPLRASLADIRDIETKGKWWLVGASWNNATGGSDSLPTSTTSNTTSQKYDQDDEDIGVMDLLQLAREQRMNTDIRRAIFVSIMSSEDYKDACARLLKLRLKRSQEREIPRVLIHCCGSEQLYNQYYTFIARQLCTAHSSKMTFQFCLWELFRKMGEEDEMNNAEFEEDEDDIDERMPMRRMVNLAKMYGSLIADGSLSLVVLKTLKFSSLQMRTKTFLELLFITVFVNSQPQPLSSQRWDEKRVRQMFAGLSEMPTVARGIGYFLKKVVKTTDIGGGARETEVVKWGCGVADKVLRAISLESAAVE